ncbi:MAG: hypothetical protein CMM45_07955, partial [Rhodospirillaceae bacterium]|nr:hypothetical protein [Rhodospirillaceae bacterium]
IETVDILMNPLRLKSLAFGNEALTPIWPDPAPAKYGRKCQKVKHKATVPPLPILIPLLHDQILRDYSAK